MRLNFHGKLRQLYGDGVTIEARNIADAIEGFSRQAENWPRDLRIIVPGYDTPDSLKETPEEVDLMPALNGGSGKFFNIVVGAAMIAVGVFTPFGIGAALATSLIVSGSMLVLQGVVGLFMKAPSFKSAQDPEASKYVAINRNTTAVGTPVTIAYGCVELAGHWLSLQSDSSNLSHGSFPATPT